MGLSLDAAISFTIADEVLHERITGRWIHQPSGRSYHTKFRPPKVPGKDDVTGEPLIQRDDDKPDKVKTRLEAFHGQTMPVIQHYKRTGKLRMVDADAPVDEVTKQIFKAL